MSPSYRREEEDLGVAGSCSALVGQSSAPTPLGLIRAGRLRWGGSGFCVAPLHVVLGTRDSSSLVQDLIGVLCGADWRAQGPGLSRAQGPSLDLVQSVDDPEIRWLVWRAGGRGEPRLCGWFRCGMGMWAR